MGRCRALLFGVMVAAAAGCGDSGGRVTPVVPGSAIPLTPAGTGGFVPVGSSGLTVFAPPGTLTQEAFLSADLVDPQAVVGAPFPGSDEFITGLQFETSVSPLAQPVEFLVPLPSTVSSGAAISVFQQTPFGFSGPVAVTNSAGSFVPFTTSTTGTFVFTRAR